MRRLAVTWLCGVVLVLGTGACSAGPWYIQTVDSAGSVGAWPSLALDGNGYPHISYLDGTNEVLKYARWTGSDWDVQTVDSTESVGWWSAIALDSSGYPHISYQDYGGGAALKYARWTGSTWDIQIVETGPGTGYDTSIVLDSSGYPRISYYHDWPDYGLKYARWTGTTWQIQMVDSGFMVGYWTSLALDADDHPHIGYCDADAWTVKYAGWNGSAWSIHTLGDGGNDSSLALDSSGYPHMAYPSSLGLTYATWNGTTWGIQQVDPLGGSKVCIALNSQGHPRIAYYRSYDTSLGYAAWNGSSWDLETADTAGDPGVNLFMDLDTNGYAHISYAESYAGDLKHATTRPPAEASHALAAPGYYMISFPVMPPPGTTAHELLCDDFGHGGYYMWRWYGGRYHSIPTNLPDCQYATVSGGDGCWVLAAAGTLDINTGGTLPYGDQVVSLRPGWNMIAVQYASTMDALQVNNAGDVRSLAAAESAGWVLGRFYYCHDGTGTYSTLSVNQVPADRLSLWHAYWVLAGLDCSLIVPETWAGGSAASRSQPAPASPLAWAFDITARSAGCSDRITIAAADKASEDFDGFALDIPKPPSAPIENGLRMALRPPGGANDRGLPGLSDLAMETKGTGQDAPQWEFVVMGGRLGETVELSWPGLYHLPRDRVAILTDTDTGEQTFMRTRAQYTLPAPGPSGARSFTVRVKHTQRAAQLISSFSVAPVRGASGAEFVYGLSADAVVDIRILNIAGRLVHRVAQGRMAEAGTHMVVWHGCSSSGTLAPSGTYLCVLQARGADGQCSRVARPVQVIR